MKKIGSLILIAFFTLSNFTRATSSFTSFGQTDPNPTNEGLNPEIITTQGNTTTPIDNTNIAGGTELGTTCGGSVCASPKVCYEDQCLTTQEKLNKENCGDISINYDTAKQKCALPSTTILAKCEEQYGMTICNDCLLNGQCKFNIYDALGIRQSVRNEGDATSVGIFVQDIVLSATMFIGTVVTIAIIVSGLMRIFAGASGKDQTKAKFGLINALIGLLIVVSSYLIIRLVQYIAKGF